MAARYLKPQTPLEQGTDYVYPVTTLDQVIGSDGSTRLNTEVESIKSDIATIETSSTAANSYAIGQYLVYNNTLYKATKAITSGATLVVGNNIQATSVGTELKSLNDSITTSTTNIISSLGEWTQAALNPHAYTAQCTVLINSVSCITGFKMAHIQLCVHYDINVPSNTTFTTIPQAFLPRFNVGVAAILLNGSGETATAMLSIDTNGNVKQGVTSGMRKVYCDSWYPLPV